MTHEEILVIFRRNSFERIERMQYRATRMDNIAATRGNGIKLRVHARREAAAERRRIAAARAALTT